MPESSSPGRLSWALWEVLLSAGAAEHEIARRLGLPYSDTIALNHVLSTQQPLGPVEVGRRLGMSSASATVLVDRLVAGGYLAKIPDPTDRRRKILQPTALAVEAANAVLAPLMAAFEQIAAELTPEESDSVLGYLRRATAVQTAFASPGSDTQFVVPVGGL